MNNSTQLYDFGQEFQLDLFHEIIVDPKFGETVIDSLDVNHFKTEAFQKIIFQLKHYYKQHEVIMTFPVLRLQIDMEIPDPAFKAQVLDTVNEIENKDITNKNVKDFVTKFCKMQSLKNVIKEISKKVERGIVDDYDQIEKKLKDALIFKETEDSITLFHDMENVLSDDFRDPTPTGISGIDDLINGGLSVAELALVIAPLGVGKTTFLTKVANNGYLSGKNVLQIFFEDKEKAIQRKHYSILSEVGIDKLSESQNLVKSRLEVFKNTFQGGKPTNNLFLQKLPADGVTITKIKNIIKKLNAKGTKIDLLVIDYIDCISLEKEYNNNTSDEWANEGRVMRLLETMIEEVNVACWTATQGNRASTSLEVVKTENMGGSLKKAQIAHFIMSIGKTLEQKESNVATISILKNRLGKDGIVYPNCKFDNGTLQIDTSVLLTEKGFELDKTLQQKEKQKKIYNDYLANRANNNPTNDNVEG